MTSERSEPRAEHPARRRRLRRRAALFSPILVLVAVLVTALGVPWLATVGALALFLVWLAVEG